MKELILAQSKFVIKAPLDRVWSLMGRVITSTMPGLERMKLIDESNFRAVMKVKVAFITIPMQLLGHISGGGYDTGILIVSLKAKGMKGLVKLNQRVKFTITVLNDNEIEVGCQSIAEGLGFLSRLLLLGMVKKMGKDILVRIEKRLKQIA
jgi:carbon monoxide dehydrogenase subunit G